MAKLFIFDKDGTLVGGIGNRPANTPGEQRPLPGVIEKLAELRASGHMIALASNQGGVAWGYISYGMACDLMRDAAEKIGGAHYTTFCPYDPKAASKFPDGFYARDHYTRKPQPGMIQECLDHFEVLPEEVVYIGDQESDKQAAEAAGVHFEWAADFFGWHDPLVPAQVRMEEKQ